MKSLPLHGAEPVGSPTPHGVGGLKSVHPQRGPGIPGSHPPRGGWIEIVLSGIKKFFGIVPPPTGWVD